VSAAGSDEPVTAPAGTSAAGTARFIEALRTCIQERSADGRKIALLLIDCGVIGNMDAAWGYHVGDAVRSRIAAALRAEVLRPGDLLGDLGRDDFACVLSPVDGPEVALLAAEKSLRALGNPFWIGDDEIYARPSIGIAMYPAHGDQPESLLQQAKSACAVARSETSHAAIYDKQQENPEAVRLLYENRLRTAVSDDALELLFQPQYDLRLGQIMGAESLLRWRDQAQGMVRADDAFAAAESAGKVTGLLSSILNRALRNCSEFRYNAGLDLRIGVNIPGRALLNAELPDVIARALGTWGLRPGRLVLEIGETSVLEAEPAARETLARLKELGVKLSIDDPDLALSSLFWLATHSFQEVKIDVALARDPAGDPKSERIMQSIIELAHKLELEVVALRVADDAVADRLKALGCDYMQADYRGPALDAEGFVRRFGFSDG
jgi:diguanylate cyclase (GGDEF)-like protein